MVWKKQVNRKIFNSRICVSFYAILLDISNKYSIFSDLRSPYSEGSFKTVNSLTKKPENNSKFQPGKSLGFKPTQNYFKLQIISQTRYL